MAQLSDDERSMLQRLTEKAEAPDEPPMNKSVSFSLDLGDESQIKRAQKLGLLPSLSDDEGDKEGDDKEGDDTPQRKGYFK